MMAQISLLRSLVFSIRFRFVDHQQSPNLNRLNAQLPELELFDKLPKLNQVKQSYSQDVGKELDSINSAICDKKKQYMVLQNYLVPARPRKILTLVEYLRTQRKYSNLTRREMEVMEKKFSDSEINFYQKQMAAENIKILAQQKAYDKNYRLLKILPSYYHMLLAYTHKDTISGQLNQKYTSQQLYQKLITAHPYVRSAVYKTYQEAHNLKSYQTLSFSEREMFKKTADRLPIFYLKHPYQLFMIDSVEATKQLAPENYFSANVEQYEARFNALSSDLQAQYKYKMQQIQLTYQSKFLEIAQKRGLELEKLEKMVTQQFDKENLKALKEMQIIR